MWVHPNVHSSCTLLPSLGDQEQGLPCRTESQMLGLSLPLNLPMLVFHYNSTKLIQVPWESSLSLFAIPKQHLPRQLLVRGGGTKIASHSILLADILHL